MQVGLLILLVDFVILDLVMGRALIDVAVGQLIMREHDKVEIFDVNHALKLLLFMKNCLLL